MGFVLIERLKRKFDTLMTAEEAAQQLGVKVDEFKQVVEEKGILPSDLFNDEPIYSLDSFGDVGVLLRAAERPAEVEQILLRPAGGVPECIRR